MDKNIVKRSKKEITSLVHEWEQSNLNKKKFCDQNGINYQTFIGWTSKHPNKIKLQESKFIPVHVDQADKSMFAEIHLSNTKKIILYQPVNVEFFQAVLKC